MALFTPEQLRNPPRKGWPGKTYRTRSLFIETHTQGPEPLMTLKEHDIEVNGKKLLSLRRIYLEIGDPTEYQVAMEVLGSWDHWNRLLESTVVKPYIDAMREELEIVNRSQALQALRKTALYEGAKGTVAAKYIAEQAWKSTRGRPSKEEKAKQLRIESAIEKEMSEDAERLGLLN